MKKRKILLTLFIVTVISLFAFGITAFAEENEQSFHTITLDYNGHGETYEIKIPDGESYYDFEIALITSDNPEDNAKEKEIHSEYYAEVDEDGVHYKVEGYYLDKEGKEEFSHTAPITEDITVYAQWLTRIDEIELTVTPPVDGTEVKTSENVWMDQTNPPEVTVPDDANYHLEKLDYDEDDPAAYWMKGKNGSPFNGTFKEGEKYYAVIWVVANDGYYYEYDKLTVTVNNATYLAENSEIDTNAMIVVEVTAAEKPAEVPAEAEEAQEEAETQTETANKADASKEMNKKSDGKDEKIPYTGKTENKLLPVTAVAFFVLFVIICVYKPRMIVYNKNTDY